MKLGDIWQHHAGERSGANAPALSERLTEEEAAIDPTIPGPARDRKRRREKEQAIISERSDRSRADADKQDSEILDDMTLALWLASDEYRRTVDTLLQDIADARRATLLAYERAVREEQEAREALDRARHNAIILADGRRVYFTQDGRALYGEDDNQITDETALAEARAKKAARPDATTYEQFQQRREQLRQRRDHSTQLQTCLDRLDHLDERIRSGALTQEELQEAKQEIADIVNALPEKSQTEFQRLQAARESEPTISYTDAGSAFPSAPDAHAHFKEASTATSVPPTPDSPASTPIPDRAPAYVAAPDFGQ